VKKGQTVGANVPDYRPCFIASTYNENTGGIQAIVGSKILPIFSSFPLRPSVMRVSLYSVSRLTIRSFYSVGWVDKASRLIGRAT